MSAPERIRLPAAASDLFADARAHCAKLDAPTARHVGMIAVTVVEALAVVWLSSHYEDRPYPTRNRPVTSQGEILWPS